MERLGGCLSTLNPMIICVGRKLGVSDRRMDLRYPDREPQPRTARGPHHSTHLAVGLWLQHLSGEELSLLCLLHLCRKLPLVLI